MARDSHIAGPASQTGTMLLLKTDSVYIGSIELSLKWSELFLSMAFEVVSKHFNVVVMSLRRASCKRISTQVKLVSDR